MPLTVTILTPGRCLLKEQACRQIELPVAGGRMGVLENHTPLVTPVEVGEIRILPAEGEAVRYLAVSSGLAEVTPERVLITAHAAESAEEIDVARAQAARARAEQRLRQRANLDIERAELALARAANRLRVARRATAE
jgi:F-type H+-transporting ATPase subunit epsilon